MVDPITGVHAISLHITDVEKARSFYRDVLGLKQLSFDAATSRLVFALPGTSALLTMHIQRPGEGGREPGTVSGILFDHPDPVAACAEIKRRGGTITFEPTLIELPGATFHRGVFADPDGNEFVISNRKD
jgi:catechol 2,3-dioxygenase-like lactoylglutathione lyase family enzyme